MTRLSVLNPNVVINTYPDSDTTNTDSTDTDTVKGINDEFISKFDLLCATGCSQDELVSKQQQQQQQPSVLLLFLPSFLFPLVASK